MLYYAIFLLSIASQCFAVVVSGESSETVNIVLSLLYVILIVSAWICAWKSQEQYDNYENEISDLKKEIKKLKEKIEEK